MIDIHTRSVFLILIFGLGLLHYVSNEYYSDEIMSKRVRNGLQSRKIYYSSYDLFIYSLSSINVCGYVRAQKMQFWKSVLTVLYNEKLELDFEHYGPENAACQLQIVKSNLAQSTDIKDSMKMFRSPLIYRESVLHKSSDGHPLKNYFFTQYLASCDLLDPANAIIYTDMFFSISAHHCLKATESLRTDLENALAEYWEQKWYPPKEEKILEENHNVLGLFDSKWLYSSPLKNVKILEKSKPVPKKNKFD